MDDDLAQTLHSEATMRILLVSTLLALAFGCTEVALDGSESSLWENSHEWTAEEETAFTAHLANPVADEAPVALSDNEAAGLVRDAQDFSRFLDHPAPSVDIAHPGALVYDLERDACEATLTARQELGLSTEREAFMEVCQSAPSDIQRCLAPNFRIQNHSCTVALEGLSADGRSAFGQYLEGFAAL